MSDKATPMIECQNLVKIYKIHDLEVLALQGLDLTIEKGEVTAIIGNSGSGKSTLLNILGGLVKPSAGKVHIDGEDLLLFNEKKLDEFKLNTVGFVWQNNSRNLIPYLTAIENIELPMLLNGKNKTRQRALELLEMVGLKKRMSNKLAELSGGEQQRIAIAISLANEPTLLLADEPTGAVDSKTTKMIFDIFQRLNKELGLTIVIVTHDREVSQMVNRVVAIRDGKTSSEFIRMNSYNDELQRVTGFDFDSDTVHEELIVLDRVGRMQLPQQLMKHAGIKPSSKVKVEVENDKIVVYPADCK